MFQSSVYSVLVLAIGLCIASQGEEFRKKLECTSHRLGAPRFELKFYPATTDHPAKYHLVKIPNNPMYGPYYHEVPTSQVVFYGETVIVTANEGRSGYAHLYFNPALTVIDIDLFLNEHMNTQGPLTHYECNRFMGDEK